MEDIDVLIPGIQNDIARELIVPKLAFSAFQVLSWVNQAWRQAIKTRQIYNVRVKSNSTRSLAVFLFTVDEDGTHEKDCLGFGPEKSAVWLYSMKENCRSRLPPIPTMDGKNIRHFGCASLNGNMYFLGGAKVSDENSGEVYQALSEVYVMDVAGMNWEWKQCASMGGVRAEFGCSVMDGKIYVFGGWSIRNRTGGTLAKQQAEVYDPKEDAWSPVQTDCRGLGADPNVAAIGDELLVYNRVNICPRPRNFLGSRRYYLTYFGEAYNPRTNQWRHAKDFTVRLHDEIKSWVVVGEKILKFDCDFMYVYDELASVWNRGQSCSFEDLEHCSQRMIVPWRIVALDGELFFAGRLYASHIPDRSIYLKSQGLGTENKHIVWHRVPEFSQIFPDEVFGSIQF